MATMRPELTEAQLEKLESRAEAKFYRACRDQLPDEVLVIYSSPWTYRNSKGALREGESDFIIGIPSSGLFAVEVKGGGIAIDPTKGVWTSTGNGGVESEIKDPFRQAKREKYALLDQLKGSLKWRIWQGSDRIVIGECVMFPDIDNVQPLVAGDRPRSMIGGRPELGAISTWLSNVSAFWTEGGMRPLGHDGVRLVEQILCTVVSVRPLLRSLLDETERDRIRLTERQAKILRIIGGRKRAVIAGGAGTGKTLIAVEKARQLAADGKRVLLLCYNRPLADLLCRTLADCGNIEVMGFHQLCDGRQDLVKTRTGRDLYIEARDAFPGIAPSLRYEVHMPFALALSSEILLDREARQTSSFRARKESADAAGVLS